MCCLPMVDDRLERIAIGALVIMALRHLGYYMAPAYADRAWWYVIITALLMLGGLLWAIWHYWPVMRRHWGVCVLGWWAAEEAMTAGCGMAWLWIRWERTPGKDTCSALADTNIGLVGAAVIACLALWLAFRPVGR